MSLRFAMVTDTHVGLDPTTPTAPTIPTAPAASAARLSRVYEAIAGLAPDFVLHCGDITDTGLPGEYDLYQQAVPAALRGRIRHVPGNHDVRWDPTAKGLYRAHFGGTPYSFDAGGVHFAGFDPTQPLLEPGHCGAAGLQWLARDLGRLVAGTPALLFQHFPVGGEHDYVDDQAALLELIAGYDVRGIFAGHVHRETVTRLDELTQVTLKAVRNDPVFYWADLTGDGRPALTVSRITVAEDRTQASSPVTTVPLSDPRPVRRHQIPAGADAPGLRLPVQAGTAERPRPQWRLRLTWLWRVRLGPVYRRPGVDGAGRTLFIPSADQHLYALDAGTGLIRWRFAAGAPVLSEPLVAPAGRHDYVVFSAGEQLLCVDAATGRLAWSVPGRGFSAGRAACDGQRVYTATADGHARAHDLHTGREAWSDRMVSGDRHRVALYSGWNDVAVTGAGVVMVATVAGSRALEAATGTVRWTFPGSTMYPPAVVLGDSTALLTTEQGVISRVRLADGGIVWQASLGVGVQNAGLVVAGDSAWVVSVHGMLIRVRLADGHQQGSVRFTLAQCFSAPAVVGDTLITGDQDGLVHGIRL
jgi:outer membrane protein assembly factor BamB